MDDFATNNDGSNKEKQALRLNELRLKANLLPNKPGCYLMKNSDQQIIYVGKSLSLKNRVTTYFNQSAKSIKTQRLVREILDFDFMVAATEAESLVLENTLIKKYMPKYNIRLKDDKSYPYVVINHNEPFPRLEYTRKVKREKNMEVYGPFVTGSNISQVLKILTDSFTLRECTLKEFVKRKEPCLYYQMKQCSAPCVNYITAENYEKDLNAAKALFDSNGKKTINALNEKMHLAAENEEFEKAAMIRDNLEVVKDFANKFTIQNAELDESRSLDVIGFYQGESEVDISIYMMRNGILLGHKNFNFSNVDVITSLEETVLNYVYQYYTITHDILPDLIISNLDRENNQLLEEAMKLLNPKTKVKASSKKYDSLLKVTVDHAFETQRVRLSFEDSVYMGLNKLKELLSLKDRPVILECYDIAIFQGSSPTAAQIVFHDGKPDRKNYRHYHLTERPEGNNDFAMMKELITRRSDNGSLPDVFIVDGGLGQVNVFREVLKEMNICIPVVGIAKSKNIKTKEGFKLEDIKKSEERLIIPGRANPYFLNQNRALFKIIVQMRDEAHRFSRRLHHKQETKRVIHGEESPKKKRPKTGRLKSTN